MALAESAFELALERGMEGFVIDDVVSRAGYSRRTFANHFSCKEEAVASVLHAKVGRAAELIADLPKDTPLVDLAHLLLTRQMDSEMLETLGSMVALLSEQPSLEPQVLAAFGLIYREAVAAVMEFTEQRYSSQRVHTLFVMAYGSFGLWFGEAREAALPEGADRDASDPAAIERFLDTTFAYLRNGFELTS